MIRKIDHVTWLLPLEFSTNFTVSGYNYLKQMYVVSIERGHFTHQTLNVE